MQVGMFQTPFLRPERPARQVFDWAVKQAVAAEKAGFSEYWIGEHQTMNWEGIPSPELVIAAAALQTNRIKLGPLAHILPYRHPALLAVQSAWLSHVLEGRYQLGVAAGAYPSDAALCGVEMADAHDMLFEALEIMEKVWKAEPFKFEGKFWKAGYPEADPKKAYRDVRPYDKIPLAMTGLSSPSSSIAHAGTHGFIPASVYAGNDFLKSHFETYKQKATENGNPYSRSMHRVVRDVIVADTDDEAMRLAVKGGMGYAWDEYITPTYKRFGVLKGLMHDQDMNPDDVDAEYLANHVWIVGSPDTVVRKFNEWFEELGGPFGTLLIYSHDYIDDPEPWEKSMHLLGEVVGPRLASAAPAETAA